MWSIAQAQRTYGSPNLSLSENLWFSEPLPLREHTVPALWSSAPIREPTVPEQPEPLPYSGHTYEGGVRGTVGSLT